MCPPKNTLNLELVNNVNIEFPDKNTIKPEFNCVEPKFKVWPILLLASIEVFSENLELITAVN